MRYADQVTEYVKRLAPEQRRAIKAGLRVLESGKAADTQPLEDELEGFYRLRVGKFRIVDRYLPEVGISCEFVEVRRLVYERFTSMLETLKE